MPLSTAIKVSLDINELAVACQVGLARQLESMKRGHGDAHGLVSTGWSENIEGACGESAFAKYLGRYWSGSVNTFKQADVGTNIQVRTRLKHDYELIVRKDDSDLDYFVLLTGKAPEFFVVGWIRGIDAKREEWLHSHGGREAAYFVPHESLRPFSPRQPK